MLLDDEEFLGFFCEAQMVLVLIKGLDLVLHIWGLESTNGHLKMQNSLLTICRVVVYCMFCLRPTSNKTRNQKREQCPGTCR